MGASLVYLDKPNTNIEFENGEDDRMKFSAGSMQGWRLNMVRLLTYFYRKILTLRILKSNLVQT